MIDLIKSLLCKSDFLQRKIKETSNLDYGREIISGWVGRLSHQMREQAEINILDVGCADGADLLSIQDLLPPVRTNLYGIDVSDTYAEAAKRCNIRVDVLNIERDRFPYPDHFFDFVICNQILEHTKEIFWIFAELSRITKKGGYLIVGVPNLAALHNRIFLAFGDQPVCIHVLGPHVRAFTKRGLQRFIEATGAFRMVDFKGSNLYPFPPFLGRWAVRILPGIAAAIFFLVKRTEVDGSFIELLESLRLDTNYFHGK